MTKKLSVSLGLLALTFCLIGCFVFAYISDCKNENNNSICRSEKPSSDYLNESVESGDEISSDNDRTESVFETTNIPEITVIPGTTNIPEITVIPETTNIPEITVVPETTNIPETTIIPETTNIPETTIIPETTNIPETLPYSMPMWAPSQTFGRVTDWYASPSAPPIPSEKDKEYTEVKKRTNCVEHLAYNDFFSAGVPVTVIYENHENVEYGRVIWVEYEGYENDITYFVKIGSSAVLHVSSGKNGSSADDYKKNIFFLTFDDGPYRYTEDVLAILSKYNVKATFFTVGYVINDRPGKIKQIVEQGHALGCHTQTHQLPGVYRSVDHMMGDVAKWERSVFEELGSVPAYKLFRFPGGSNSAGNASKLKGFSEALTSVGYKAFDWNCSNSDAWFDAKKEDQTMDEYLRWMFKTTLAQVKNSSRYRVCLMHETNSNTLNMLEWALNYAMEQGYCFRTLDVTTSDLYF